jgi:hypothetical protein
MGGQDIKVRSILGNDERCRRYRIMRDMNREMLLSFISIIKCFFLLLGDFRGVSPEVYIQNQLIKNTVFE